MKAVRLLDHFTLYKFFVLSKVKPEAGMPFSPITARLGSAGGMGVFRRMSRSDRKNYLEIGNGYINMHIPDSCTPSAG